MKRKLRLDARLCERGIIAFISNEQNAADCAIFLQKRCIIPWLAANLWRVPEPLRRVPAGLFIPLLCLAKEGVYPKKSLRRQRHSRLRRRGVQALPTTVTGSCIQLNLRCVHLMRHVEYNLRPLDDNASSSEGTDDSAYPVPKGCRQLPA